MIGGYVESGWVNKKFFQRIYLIHFYQLNSECFYWLISLNKKYSAKYKTIYSSLMHCNALSVRHSLLARTYHRDSESLPMNVTNGNSLKYRADVDGLRAVAVLAVLFYHADLGCHGGYVGVDVFFCISGFLITGLILKDLDAGQFQIVKFWERRIRRILPPLVVVILATLIAGWFLLLPHAYVKLGQSVCAQALLSSNIYFWQGYLSEYFDLSEVKPLLHTWSLAVEEQYYLFFPFLLLALRRFSRSLLVTVILVLGGLSFALSVYYSYQHPSANFYLLPTRAWELLIGAFLAAIPAHLHASRRWVAESLSWGGVLAILCAVFCYDSETRFPGVTAILPCFGTALIIWANGHTLTVTGKILALRPVVFVGLISYSLYLWHWPILVLAGYLAIEPMAPSQRMLLLLASLVLAVLSWRFVETPFRRRVIFKNRAQIFAFFCSSTALLLLSGLALHKLQGVPSRLPAAALLFADGQRNMPFNFDISLKQALAGDFVEFGSGDKHLPIDLMVWGDSHAMAVMPVLEVLCKEHSIRGVAATHTATPPLVGYLATNKFSMTKESIAYNSAVIEFIRKEHISNILLVTRWDQYIDFDNGTARLRNGILATIRALQGTGTKIWIMRDVPVPRWNVPDVLASTIWHGGDLGNVGLPNATYSKEYQRQSPLFEGLSTDFSGVTILDPTETFMTPNKGCRVENDGMALYWDGSHLTVAGAMLLRPLFIPIFMPHRQISVRY